MATEGNEGCPAVTEPADDLAELRAVVAKAKAGDTSALPRLRELLDGYPNLVGHYGDLARQADAAWVALAAGSNLYMRETLARAAETRRDELTRPGAQPVERLLVERVVACWLQVNYLAASEANALAAGDNYRQLQYHARRVERAQRMHLAALGALVTYQKLVPAAVAGATSRAQARASIDNEPRVGAELGSPATTVDLLYAADPVAQSADETEHVRVRVPC